MGDDVNSSKLQKSGSGGSSGNDSSKWKIHDTPQDAGLLPTIAVTLWLGWNGFILWITLYTIFLADKWQRIVIIGLVTSSLVLPVNFPGALGNRWGNWMMRQAEKYFGKKSFIAAICVFLFGSWAPSLHKFVCCLYCWSEVSHTILSTHSRPENSDRRRRRSH